MNASEGNDSSHDSDLSRSSSYVASSSIETCMLETSITESVTTHSSSCSSNEDSSDCFISSDSTESTSVPLPYEMQHPAQPILSVNENSVICSHSNDVWHNTNDSIQWTCPLYQVRQHVSRNILVSQIPVLDPNFIIQVFESWGPIRCIDLQEVPNNGSAVVCYFDIRHARQAVFDIQSQNFFKCKKHRQRGERNNRGLLGGYVIWANFLPYIQIPFDSFGPENQGTLVIFNVKPETTAEEIKTIFEIFGRVKEVREGPIRKEHRFVEFFDVRDAHRAVVSLDGAKIANRKVKVEFSCPWGNKHMLTRIANQLMLASRLIEMPAQQNDFTSYETHNQFIPIIRQLPMMAPSLNNAIQIEVPRQQPEPVKCQNDTSALESSSEQFTGVDVKDLPAGSGAMVTSVYSPTSGESNEVTAGSVDSSAVIGYNFNEEEACGGRGRTTLMIRNIPNKLTQSILLTLIDSHCRKYNSQTNRQNDGENAFDFFYLPVDFKNHCNLGYAFVNFTTAAATLNFFREFHCLPWKAFSSKKVCKVAYAKLQGIDSLKEHFKNSKFGCCRIDILPLIYDPPRNGRNSPRGIPVVRCKLSG